MGDAFAKDAASKGRAPPLGDAAASTSQSDLQIKVGRRRGEFEAVTARSANGIDMQNIKSRVGLAAISFLRKLPNGVSDSDFVLASFPKSGNTWVRFFFANLLANRMEQAGSVDFHSIERYSPAVGGKMHGNGSLPASPGPRPIKTHYNRSFRYSGRPSLLLVRDPIKCVPAYRDYLESARNVRFADAESFLSSWRYGTAAWQTFHDSWLGHADFVIRYEDLVSDPHKWLFEITQYLGFDYSEKEVATAIEQSSREAMKSAETKGDPYHDAGYTFVRGEGEKRFETDPLSEEQFAHLREATRQQFAQLTSGSRG